jgi:type I restriction enzyme S subunit
VIFTCVGDLGIASISGKDFVMNQQLHSFQPNEKINAIFLMFNINYRKDYMYKMATSTTVPYINKTICNNIPILLPPIELQNQFADIVQKTERLKQSMLTQSKELDTNFNALMQGAFA